MDSIRNGAFGLTNTNRLVRFYQGATGLKTGSTAKAKFCVSATAKRGNMHLICVVMGAPSSDVRNSIATQLLNWGFANFELYENPSEQLNNLKVKGGVQNECNIMSLPFAHIVNKGEAGKVEKKYVVDGYVSAPLIKGDVIGHIEYSINGKVIGRSDIVSTVNVEKIDFWHLFVRILSIFLIK